MKKKILRSLLALISVGTVVAATGCDLSDTYGVRRQCTEFRMAAFGGTWGEHYGTCAEAFPG